MKRLAYNEPIKIKDFVVLFGGDEDEKIAFYECNTKETVIIPVGDLYIDDRYDDILNSDMASWEYTDGIITILYFIG